MLQTLLANIASSLPPDDRSTALRDLSEAATDTTKLADIGKSILEKQAKRAEQKRQPQRVQSRAEQMKVVRDYDPTKLDLTIPQAQRLHAALTQILDAEAKAEKKRKPRKKKA
jgi:hypothetical protein